MKKELNLFLCIFCMTLSISVFGQNEEITNISAVKLTPAVGKQYYNEIKIKAFTVDKNYILRPAKGYKIVYFPADKKIAILSKTMKLENSKPVAPGFDVQEVPGGTMYCLCDGRGSDDCAIKPRIADKTLYFDCFGSCGCGSFTIYDTSDPIIGYETAGGGWFNF